MANLITKQKLSYQCDAVGLSALVSSICALICEATDLEVLDIIEYGSDEFNGYPIYNVGASDAGLKIQKVFYDNAHQSDIYILGKDRNNYCLIVNVYNGELMFSLGCSKDYADWYGDRLIEKSSTITKSNPLTIVTRKFISGSGNYYNVFYPLVKDTEGIVNLTVAKYKGEISQGFKFINNSGKSSAWYLFTCNDNGEKYAILNQQKFETVNYSNFYTENYLNETGEYNVNAPLIVAFDEAISRNVDNVICVNRSYSQTETNLSTVIDNNSYMNTDLWYNAYVLTNNTSHIYICTQLSRVYRLNGVVNLADNQMNISNKWVIENLKKMNYVTVQNSILNLPKLKQNQVYIRRLYAPNTNKKFHFYLWFSPVTEVQPENSFYKIAGETYLLTTPGCIGYAIKV